MLHINQPFFSITAAVIYTLFGLLFASSAVTGNSIIINAFELNASIQWGVTGVMFIMAYFSLVHLKYR